MDAALPARLRFGRRSPLVKTPAARWERGPGGTIVELLVWSLALGFRQLAGSSVALGRRDPWRSYEALSGATQRPLLSPVRARGAATTTAASRRWAAPITPPADLFAIGGQGFNLDC